MLKSLKLWYSRVLNARYLVWSKESCQKLSSQEIVSHMNDEYIEIESESCYFAISILFKRLVEEQEKSSKLLDNLRQEIEKMKENAVSVKSDQ